MRGGFSFEELPLPCFKIYKIMIYLKNCFIALLLTIFTVSSAQQKTYVVEYAATSASGSTGKGNILKFNGNTSLYGRLNDLDKGNSDAVTKEQINNDMYFKSNKVALVYKDLDNNTMLSDEKIFLENYLVKDVTNTFKWTLSEQTREILGHPCKKATTQFRGRTYEAYYALDLKFPFGPWKFSGLPGLILSVRSEDNFIKYEAINIQQIEGSKIVNPYKDVSKAISFQEFKDLYVKKYKETTKETKLPDGRTVKSEMPKGGKEIYVD